ncbi:hypothetical protein, partial [Xanthomonas euvesicatoria]|uniref:hypothetical protein n=1 Tax=Xanthomonas euvesicatoria TaxID=456327 RepID=UPI0038925F81
NRESGIGNRESGIGNRKSVHLPDGARTGYRSQRGFVGVSFPVGQMRRLTDVRCADPMLQIANGTRCTCCDFMTGDVTSGHAQP